MLLPALPAVAGLLAATVLLGVAGAADSVAPGAVMGDVVAGRGGTVVAVFQMSGDLGAVLGPVVAGWIADGAGYPADLRRQRRGVRRAGARRRSPRRRRSGAARTRRRRPRPRTSPPTPM